MLKHYKDEAIVALRYYTDDEVPRATQALEAQVSPMLLSKDVRRCRGRKDKRTPLSHGIQEGAGSRCGMAVVPEAPDSQRRGAVARATAAALAGWNAGP
jgi:hypothetical protein